jgi:hypothetical protein
MRMVGHGVDQHLVPAHVRGLSGDFRRNLVPHHHVMALGIRLGDHGEELARAALRQPEGEAHEALDPWTGKHGDVRCGLQRRALVDAPADAGVFALRILAQDHPVEFLARHKAQGRGDVRQHPLRPHVGALVKWLTDGEAQTPERDAVRDVRVACRAEQDGIVAGDLSTAVLRHHAAVPLEVLVAPIEAVDLEAEAALACGERLEHPRCRPKRLRCRCYHPGSRRACRFSFSVSPRTGGIWHRIDAACTSRGTQLAARAGSNGRMATRPTYSRLPMNMWIAAMSTGETSSGRPNSSGTRRRARRLVFISAMFSAWLPR